MVAVSKSAVGRFVITPSGRALGADVAGVDLRRPLAPGEVEAIRHAWAEHLVLRFRGQRRLTLEQLAAFSRNFGELDRAPIRSDPRGQVSPDEHPEITVISNVIVDGRPIGGLGAYEAVWHADMTYNPRPPKGSALYAVEIPPTGGNTHFANMYLAYETLPPDLKHRAETLKCVHDASRNSAGELRIGFTDVSDPSKTVGAVHPVVRTHPETGRKCLFLGRRRNAYLVGLPLEESEALLDALWAYAVRPELVWEQVWQVDDIVLWDNRCTMHRRDSFDPGSRRLLYRTQIVGEEVT
ncbi:MAG TPA: TauD/TfdA family dioxygenase [Burkholderiales bacterium]|nr:TauD/TfdA family dioxygenase [Burkholderiales bacterium]